MKTLLIVLMFCSLNTYATEAKIEKAPFKANNPALVPERALEKTIAGLKEPTYQNLVVYRTHFHFEKDALKTKDFTSVSMNVEGSTPPHPRLILIFQKDALAGIAHLNDLKIANKTQTALKGGYHLTWFATGKTDPTLLKILNQRLAKKK